VADTGGQPGNQNARRARLWQEALKRALARSTGTVDNGLNSIADKLVAFALEGEQWAIEHIADRLDGKPKQVIEGKFEHEHKVETGSADSLSSKLQDALRRRTEPTVQ
jgi:hypothetical protein